MRQYSNLIRKEGFIYNRSEVISDVRGA